MMTDGEWAVIEAKHALLNVLKLRETAMPQYKRDEGFALAMWREYRDRLPDNNDFEALYQEVLALRKQVAGLKLRLPINEGKREDTR